MGFLGWLIYLPVCAAIGLIYAVVFQGGGRLVSAAIYGIAIGVTIMAFERGYLLHAVHTRMRRWPTYVYVPAAEVTYVALATAGHAAGAIVNGWLGFLDGPLREAVVPSPQVLLYSLAITAVLVAAMRVRDLVGGEVLINLLVGRYHRPVEEERIFLFIDLVGSTAYAQRHGDLRAQEFLSAIFAALADPVRRHHGSVDDYVGDMALVTWPLAKGIAQARCVACVFDFLDDIAREAQRWLTTFGEVPAFRAALHGGAVVTAEVGVNRHKISYFGDVVNTTGRMEALCKTLDADLLISGDLLRRLPDLPAGITARDLGPHALKGRGQQLTVLALEPG